METISTLGKLLPEGHTQGRDAVHIAVMPVVAGETLWAGGKLKLAFGTSNVVLEGEHNGDDWIGRTDPFLERQRIEKGQHFWMWLRPGTITGLRHEWSHPAIDAQQKPANESQAWLRSFADRWNFDYDEMVAEALGKEGCVTARGRDLHGADELDAGDEQLFWHHIEALTGQAFDEGHKKGFGWSCSC